MADNDRPAADKSRAAQNAPSGQGVGGSTSDDEAAPSRQEVPVVPGEPDETLRKAAESASKKPAPHGTPHEVQGSPVRNPDDLKPAGDTPDDPARRAISPNESA
jgi:hypothetical protein